MRAGGLILAGLAAPRPARTEPAVEIRMKSDAEGAHVRFDPIGLLIRPGQVVRWVIELNVHTTTAYHPANDHHSLRIPVGAAPWDSGYLVDSGQSFEVRFTVEGVYDYFCTPHEAAGMVGRIVVGRPGGPGMLPFDYFKSDPAKASWRAVPEAAQRSFPAVAQIIAQGRVSAT